MTISSAADTEGDTDNDARTLVIVAHPHLARSRVTRTVLQALSRARPGVEVHDLYRRHPDFWIDVAAEQAALARAARVVWLYPTHWYAMPALLKLWIDEVLAFGWAYGPGGHALRGKRLWVVTSTGGAEAAYQPDGHHGHPFDAFLLPVRQTARLTGMAMAEPLVLHGAHRADDAALQAHAAAFVRGLDALGLPAAGECCAEVPVDERPPLAAPQRLEAGAAADLRRSPTSASAPTSREVSGRRMR